MSSRTQGDHILPSWYRVVRSKSLPVVVACLWLVLSTAMVWAETVVFDNFGVGDSYNNGDVWFFTEGVTPYSSGDKDSGMSFTPSQGGPLSNVWFVAGLLTGDNELDVWVMDDLNGYPESILESWHFGGALGPWDSIIPPTHAVGNGTTLLTAGTQYWLVLSATGPNAAAGWYWNDTDDLGTVVSRENLESWHTIADVTRGAFRVAVVPEPMTLSFLVLGGLAMIRRRRGG